MEAVSRRMVDVIIWYVQRFNNPYLLKILFIENAKKYSGIPLIPPPMGQKKFGCYNEVTVLTRVSLQENVWAFLPGGQKKCLTAELAVRQGSTVMLSVTCCGVLQWYCSFFNICDFQFSYFSHWFFCFVLNSQQCIKCKHGMLNILRLKCITE